MSDTENKDHEPEVVGAGDFAYALKALKNGAKVTRFGWNGRDMHVVLMPGYPDGIIINDTTQKAHKLPEGTKLCYRPYFQLFTNQKDVANWTATDSDLLAEDWLIVES